LKYTAAILHSMSSTGSSNGHRRVVFTAALSPESRGTSALLLAESIRAFAGHLSESPIWLYITPNADTLPCDVEDRLLALDTELIPFKVDREASKFFFLPEVIAAAEAEAKAEEVADTLVWLGTNTIVLHEPIDFALPGTRSIGYRPVHITNVGSLIDAPLDAFWSLIYERCGVSGDRVFPMKTHVDSNTVRPYFNAGHVAVRPERRLMRKWCEAFISLYKLPEFERFYADGKYRIFMHQAVLSGVILANYQRDELLELPPTYNYPIHLFEEDATGRRPGGIEELVTVRHEGFYDEPDWEKKMPAGETLKKWIREKLLVS
jgi:hypothetical protein